MTPMLLLQHQHGGGDQAADRGTREREAPLLWP